jgi:hypothetical protein
LNIISRDPMIYFGNPTLGRAIPPRAVMKLLPDDAEVPAFWDSVNMRPIGGWPRRNLVFITRRKHSGETTMTMPLKGIRMDIERQVIQLLPADGWRAQYKPDPDRTSSVTEDTLLCWALVREGKEFLVVGVVVDGKETKFVDLDKRFVGYRSV